MNGRAGLTLPAGGAGGLAGVALLLVVAVVAPLLVPAHEVSPVLATGPVLAGPSWDYLLGTDG